MAQQQPTHGESAALRRRLTSGWALTVEIATVLAGVVALIAYVYPRAAGNGAPGGRSVATPPAVTAPATAAGSSTAAPQPASLSLTQLTPSEGGAYLSATGTASTLVLRCPSGNSGDTSRTVVYEVRGQYRRLVAGFRVTGSPTPPTRSALEVLADDVRTGFVLVDGNGTKPLAADLIRPNPQGADPVPAQRLSLRVTCRLVGPTITLIDPRLEP